ncbi:hypothetical protein [Ferrimicrobium acidiphilum]|uniref:hypothetical protein n=1 Tax=Ferrimicrobium acidiphilum TaxID=121039 RepID=UPI00146FEE70|nr:hypothetical protein [Ferrimicrobium acidiphilum]
MARGASTIAEELTVAGVLVIRMSVARLAVVENAAVVDAPSHGPVIPIDPAPPMAQDRLPEFVRTSENATLKPPRGATGPTVAVSIRGSQGSVDVEAVGDAFDSTWLPERDPDVATLGEDAEAIPLNP